MSLLTQQLPCSFIYHKKYYPSNNTDHRQHLELQLALSLLTITTDNQPRWCDDGDAEK